MRIKKVPRAAPVDPASVRIDNAFYDNLGDLWWDRQGQMSALHEMNPVRLAYFNQIFTRFWGTENHPSRIFIDVGCGGGILTEALAGRDYHITGLDISEGALQAAKRHAAATRVKVEYRRSSAYQLGIKTASVDGVIASDLFEHLHDFPRAVSEMARVLKTGGVLAFDTVNRTWLSFLGGIWVAQKWLHLIPPHTHDWKMFITPEELKKVFSNSGLEVREIQGLSPAAHFLRLPYILWKRRKFGPYRLSSDIRISYIGYAVKTS
jgi:2-polyprenyl-6-hydroxyphenyl methylase / 3-demethylubiquinone-9 3-methyltransferase